MAEIAKTSILQQLEDTLDLYLVKKAPFTLPPNVKEAIVKYGPWITLVLLLLSLPAILAIFSLGALLSPMTFLGGPKVGLNYVLNLVIMVVTVVLELVAIPSLLKRLKRGWYLLYYAVLLSAVGDIVSYQIGSLIIGTLISLYILFQVRSYYK